MMKMPAQKRHFDILVIDWNCWTKLDHCSYHRYLYQQGTQKRTLAAILPALALVIIKSAPPAKLFDTPVTGIR